ncbi:helix-turn-helix domain-containing protein [Bacillus alkalicellulosilyticus]|uniref:helix-turn-helix domain-containing protein n=1 Tax=Alkalihalobacterium alkalicellulosilyticum TaxID=1912214 RepID=UPI00111713BD|nr:XRE family transcriptional regulator [Bacillus alkalicellulosilyticus]
MQKTEQVEEIKLKITLGQRLRKLRNRKRLSLDDFSKMTNVSKLTLGNIERGEANPSLSVIWKVAAALNIPVSSLLIGENEITIAKADHGNTIISADGTCSIEPMFNSKEGFDMHRAYLKEHSEYKPGSHQPGVIQYVTVLSGEVIISIEEESFHLKEHEGIRFSGESAVTYLNPTATEVALQFVVVYTT